MQIKFVVICILLTGSTYCHAQEIQYRHAVSAGASLLRYEWSENGLQVPGGIFLNYEYMFGNSARGFWSAQAGLGAFGFHDYYHGYAFPTVFGYNWGKRQRFFQLGMAGHYIIEHYDTPQDPKGPHRDQTYFAGPQLGYKRIHPKGYYFGTYLGLITPIATTYAAPPPQYVSAPHSGVTLTLSISVGRAFGKQE